MGNTPVLWISELTGPGGFWAKLEGSNPGGMKDRTALHMIGRAIERGELERGGRIVESISGTLGLGLALAGIVYGNLVTLVTNPGMEPIVHRMPCARTWRATPVNAGSRRSRCSTSSTRPGSWSGRSSGCC